MVHLSVVGSEEGTGSWAETCGDKARAVHKEEADRGGAAGPNKTKTKVNETEGERNRCGRTMNRKGNREGQEESEKKKMRDTNYDGAKGVDECGIDECRCHPAMNKATAIGPRWER